MRPTAAGRVITDVFSADDARWRGAVFDPLPQRQKDVVIGIFWTAKIVRAIEYIGACTAATM